MKSLAENLKDDEELVKYLPDKWHKKLKLDREWFFNILNTVHPGYLQQIIKHAQKQRQTANTEEEKKETITITDEWKKRLEQSTFISNK